MGYSVQPLTPEEKDRLYQSYESRFLFTNEAEICGCCVELLTYIEHVKNPWEDNSYKISENIRSHGRHCSGGTGAPDFR